MTAALHSRESLELVGGNTVPIVLTWRLLSLLERLDHGSYEFVSDLIMKNGLAQMGLLDAARLVHVGYLCGVIEETGSLEGALSFDDFIDALQDGVTDPVLLAMRLIDPKGAAASQGRS